ncbi:MAG TPA: deoxyribonuclease IV [Armatimonadota bacterium]|nr:deoxyribonuclease IV [Armatimonadota bacterium]
MPEHSPRLKHPSRNRSRKSSNGAAPPETPLVGAHMPTTGGIHRALLEGAAIGCTAVQLFTSSPQQWKSRSLTPEQIALFGETHVETGCVPLIVHDSYLINLATASTDLREKSQRAFLEEMERCEALGIQYLVTHCGARGDESEEQGLSRLADSLSTIHRATAGYRLRVALEITAGQGTCLGHRFEQFTQVLHECPESDRLSVCFDTCHAFAAGYDFREREGYERVMEEFDDAIGLNRLAVLHLNDSRKDLGSRVDRHHHIGRGYIGAEAFRLIMRDPRFEGIPKIVETPDFSLHKENIRVLRGLAKVSRRIGPRTKLPFPLAGEPAAQEEISANTPQESAPVVTLPELAAIT